MWSRERLRRTGAVALTLALLAGCPKVPREATPPARDDLYVLLPAPDGKTGALTVAHADREQVLSAPYAAARIRAPGRIETGPVTPEEIQRVFGQALAALPARPATFILYFVEGRDEFTPESRQVMSAIFAEIANRPSPEVVVIGHTDRVGSVAFNDSLSLQRAERVRTELVRLGVRADQIEVAGRGWREPLVAAAEGVPEPRNRRVEISVR
jgi:outer membrane protein OmpA-like peptidoglycan-associated protein